MSQHDPLDRVRDMLSHAIEASDMAQNRTRTDLDADRMLNLALVRLMEIVGEAAAHVPEEIRSTHPQVPWQDIAGLRNRLIHGYGAIDFDILWTIIQDDLPVLISELQLLISND